MGIDVKRAEIDSIDDRLMSLILERAGVAASIGAIKKETAAPVLDGAREKEVESRYSSFAEANGLDPSILAEIARLLMTQCRSVQYDL